MSTAETAPQTNIPNLEQQPPNDATIENQASQPIDEARVALGGVSREARGSQGRSERQQAQDDFYSELGKAALSIATTGKLGEHSVAPTGFLQRRATLKAMKKAEAVKDARSQQEHMMLVYPTTGGSSRVKHLKTFKARRKAKDTAKKQLANGDINLLEYRNRREATRNERVYASALTKEVIDEKNKKALNKLKKAVKYQDPIVPSDTSTPAVESSAPPQLTDTVEIAPIPQTPETSVTETASTQELTQAEKNVAVLAKLRDAGLLPPPTPRNTERVVSKELETTPEPEAAEKNVVATAQNILLEADRLMAEQTKAGEPKLNKDDLILELLEKSLVSPDGTPDSDISAKGLQILDAVHELEAEAQAAAKPKSTEQKELTPAEKLKDTELLDQASVEQMAEIAYIAAKDKVYLQIDAEDRQRRADGKPKLTREEKAEYWKNERGIRQQLLGDLSPENKSLVNKQIGELMKADKAARQAGQEQLRDKRRRERREQQAAERQAQPTKTPRQRSNETVQQRARREREEKAKQKIADGQRTFSHPDIPG